eukprot:358174-Chlamydomonas_euryale.AAC.2
MSVAIRCGASTATHPPTPNHPPLPAAPHLSTSCFGLSAKNGWSCSLSRPTSSRDPRHPPTPAHHPSRPPHTSPRDALGCPQRTGGPCSLSRPASSRGRWCGAAAPGTRRLAAPAPLNAPAGCSASLKGSGWRPARLWANQG